MVDKVKVGYLIPTGTQERLRALAERDRRSLSGEVAWLVEREWRRHVRALSMRRAQRLQRTQQLARVCAAQQEGGGPGGQL